MTSVAVVIPAHNRADLLAITLDNVLCQEGIDLQIVVVDDGSTDAVPEVIAKFVGRDSRLVAHRFETPQGACKARNVGLALTDAPFVTFLDSDDLMHPEKLARQVALLSARPDIGLAVCQMAHFSKDPNEADLLWNTFVGDSPRDRFLRHDPVFGIHSPLWRRTELDRVGGFDETLPMAQEYDLQTRALLMGCLPLLTGDLLAYCRRHEEGSISTSKRIARMRTLIGVFKGFKALLGTPSDTDRRALAGNFLWVANLASLAGERAIVKESLSQASSLGANSFSFSLLCQGALATGRHRFFQMARQRALAMGHDLSSRESWHLRHRLEDEPDLVRYPMPDSSWKFA